MLAQGCRLAVAGSVLGVIASLAISGLLRAFVFEIGSSDIGTLLSVAVLVLIVAIGACYPPARPAAAVRVISR